MKTFFSFILFFIFSTINAQSFIRTELPTALNNPWEITYGPDGYLWLTEYGGNVVRVDPNNGNKTIVFTASDYYDGSPTEDNPLCTHLSIGSGTLGLALHPDFMDSLNSYIYFVYSYNNGTAPSPSTKFRIKRLKWDWTSNSVISDTNIVNNISNGYDHFGGRLIAVKQNNTPYLYFSLGDLGRSEDSDPNCYSPQSNNPNNFTQDISTQNGKIHRFNMDGSIPLDNPIAGNSFYTRGHRNPQGLMFNPNLEILYNVEHGDRTDDEINVLYKGMNYGWKNVRGFHNDGSYTGESTYVANYSPNPLILNDSLVEPIHSWCNIIDTSSFYLNWCTVAPSDGIYYGSTGIPQWTNSLLVVTLKDGLTTDKEVFQFQLLPNGMIDTSTFPIPNPKKYFGNDQALNGRLRDIAISPNGRTIYLINNGGSTTDKITVYEFDTTNIGIDNKIIEHKLKLYPNPAKDVIKIKGLSESKDIKEIMVYSILGKYESIELQNENSLDISKLNSGIYFIQLLIDKKIYFLKFVKQ